MKNEKIRYFDFIEKDIHLNLLNSFQCLEEGSYKKSTIQMGCFSLKIWGSFTLPENKSACKVDQEGYTKILDLDLSQDNRFPGGCLNRLDKEKWLKHPLWLILQKFNFSSLLILLHSSQKI